MPFALQPCFYAHVPVWLWPWVLWQILGLLAWSDETGRAIAFSVNQNGRVYLDYVADPPSLWHAGRMRDYVRPVTDWLAAPLVDPVEGLGRARFCLRQVSVGERACAGMPVGTGLRRFPTGLSPP